VLEPHVVAVAVRDGLALAQLGRAQEPDGVAAMLVDALHPHRKRCLGPKRP
jgi:hypothetical protein